MWDLIAVSTSSFAVSHIASSFLQRSMSCCAASSVGYLPTGSPRSSITMKALLTGSILYPLVMGVTPTPLYCKFPNWTPIDRSDCEETKEMSMHSRQSHSPHNYRHG